MARYNNIIISLFILILFGCEAPNSNINSSEKISDLPNILWITVEDMSAHLGCYGDEVAKTPTIDSLAGEGLKYTNAFGPTGVCAPNRASLITGMYPTSI